MEYKPTKPSEQILIVTEDTNSFNIFIKEKLKDLKLNKKGRGVELVLKNSKDFGGDTSPKNLIQSALIYVSQQHKKGKFFTKIYCVMDVDDFDTTPNFELRTEAKRLINTTLVQGIPIISNEMSEIWYILHFRNETDRESEIWRENQQKRNPTIPDEQVSDNILAGYLGKTYQKTEKSSKALYKTIKDKESIAIKNAKYLQDFHTKNGNVIIENYYYGNPSSQVYILIEHLNELAQIK
jgi:RloB-like protein